MTTPSWFSESVAGAEIAIPETAVVVPVPPRATEAEETVELEFTFEKLTRYEPNTSVPNEYVPD